MNIHSLCRKIIALAFTRFNETFSFAFESSTSQQLWVKEKHTKNTKAILRLQYRSIFFNVLFDYHNRCTVYKWSTVHECNSKDKTLR